MNQHPAKWGKGPRSSRKIRRRARWGWRPELIVESLEQRQLLSITPSYNPTTKTLTFTDPANLNDNLTLAVSSGDIEYSTDGVNFSPYAALTALSAIVVHLGNGNDTLNIAPTLSDVLSTDNITVQDAGGTGQNTLASLASAADATQTWNLTGAGTGTLDGQVRFGGVANLVGGSGTDNFVMGAGMQGSGSDTTITAGVGDNSTLDFSAYAAPVTVDLSAGTATDLASVTDLNNVIGGSGLNTITGDSQDSTITAGPGNNVLTAGSGLDTFVFNADVDHGSTQIYGGTTASTATLDFSPTQNTPVTVDLSSTAAQQVTPNLTLTLESGSTVNDVIGGAAKNIITANSADDDITAGTGANVLYEGTGLDTFTFDADDDKGNTQIWADPNSNDQMQMAALDFSPTQSTAINVDLSKTVAQAVTPNLSITLEPGNTVDQVTGGDDANTFTPNESNDVLIGGAGSNTYMLDADLSLGSVAIETTEGAVDTLDFGPTQTTAVTVDLSQVNPQTITSNFSLYLEPAGGITGVIGGQAANTVAGDSLDNVFTAGPGNNTFTPGTGNDTVAIDADTAKGTDLINAPTASGGTTTLDFSSTKNSAVTVSLASTAAQQVTTNLSLTLAAGNDASGVIGGAAANTVTGNGQNDVFTRRTGQQYIHTRIGQRHLCHRRRHGRRHRRYQCSDRLRWDHDPRLLVDQGHGRHGQTGVDHRAAGHGEAVADSGYGQRCGRRDWRRRREHGHGQRAGRHVHRRDQQQYPDPRQRARDVSHRCRHRPGKRRGRCRGRRGGDAQLLGDAEGQPGCQPESDLPADDRLGANADAGHRGQRLYRRRGQRHDHRGPGRRNDRRRRRQQYVRLRCRQSAG